MKVTATQLFNVIKSLPDPQEYYNATGMNYIKVPICEPVKRAALFQLPVAPISFKPKELVFSIDREFGDWILLNLDL